MAILLLFLQKFELKWRKLKLKNKLKKIIPSALFRLVVYVNGRAYFSDSTYGLSARPEYISRMFLDVAGKTTCRGGTTCHRLQPRRQLTFHRFRTTFFSEPQRHFTAEPNAPRFPGFSGGRIRASSMLLRHIHFHFHCHCLLYATCVGGIHIYSSCS